MHLLRKAMYNTYHFLERSFSYEHFVLAKRTIKFEQGVYIDRKIPL